MGIISRRQYVQYGINMKRSNEAPHYVRIRSIKMKPRSRSKLLSCMCCVLFNHKHKILENLNKKEIQESITDFGV